MKRIILTYILSFIVLTLQTGFSDRGTEIPLFSDDGYSYNPYYSPMSDDFGDFGGWYNGGYGDGCSCPNGGYETTGVQTEDRQEILMRAEIKFIFSGKIQIVNAEAIGSIAQEFEILREIEKLITTAYECDSKTDSKCCVCFRYVLDKIRSSDPQ